MQKKGITKVREMIEKSGDEEAAFGLATILTESDCWEDLGLLLKKFPNLPKVAGYE